MVTRDKENIMIKASVQEEDSVINKYAREFQKNLYYASLTTLKPLTAWITTNCGKFFKRWEYLTTLPAA